MEQEQTNVNEKQEVALNTQVTFDFLKTPITQIADYIIIAASNSNASDIHFDPRENGMMVRFRVDGDLQDYSYIPKAYERNLTTRLKLLANMNITESRLPQDGAIKGMFGDTYLDMRVSCLPLNEGEKIVIRILDYTRSLQGIDSLGFHPDNLVKLKRMMAAPNGIILTTGATGSGKSTTTYSILQGLNAPETNIITVEDPIEMNIQGINQVQVNSEIGMTFAAALRSILRQDPNVILIGEIRDSETAQIAVRSAITGHLVLSTIHTNNSLSTIERLMDMDVERYLLSTALVGIISQRLAKGICQKCKFKRKTTPYEQKIFRNFLRLDVKTIWDANPKGCPECRRGYKGRIAIQEVLELDDDIRTALNNTKLSKEELRAMVYTDKTITMLQDALIKCINGETNFEEVYRVIEMENDGEDYTAELTAAIEEFENGKMEGVDGADILDSLQNTPISIDTANIVVQQSPTTPGALPNVVNNLQQVEAQPAPAPQPVPATPVAQPAPAPEPQQAAPVAQETAPAAQPATFQNVNYVEQQVQATTPASDSVVISNAPQTATATPTTTPNVSVAEQPVQTQGAVPQNTSVGVEIPLNVNVNEQSLADQGPVSTTVSNTDEEVPLNVAIVDQPNVEQGPVTTSVQNTAQDTPLNVAIVEQPNVEQGPIEVTLVAEKEEPLSEEVVEVPVADFVEEERVRIPTYEEVKIIEEQQRLEEEKRLEEQRKLEEQQRIEEEKRLEELKKLEEQRRLEEAPIIIDHEVIANAFKRDKKVDEEKIEEKQEEVVELLSEETPESDEDMFDGNVIVDDNGVQEEEVYSVYDFRNNQPMQFDENNEPILIPLVVDRKSEEEKEKEDTKSKSKTKGKKKTKKKDKKTSKSKEKKEVVEEEQVEEVKEPDYIEDTVDSPNPDCDIEYQNIDTKVESDEDDVVTRTVEYDGNVVEMFDTSFEIEEKENIEEEKTEEENLDNESDISKIDKKIESIAELYEVDKKEENNENNEDKEEADTTDLSNVDVDSLIKVNDIKDLIGSDFVDENGPLLEEIPRLGTESEELEETLQFDPDAFTDIEKE